MIHVEGEALLTVMADLAALQAVDSELDRLRRAVGELQGRIADDTALRDLRAVRAATAASLQQQQLAQRRYEGESASERLEIQRREQRLSGPAIHDMHSYQATQSEIEQHTTKLRDLEDSLVAAMEDVEVTTQQLQEMDAKIAAAAAERAQQVAAWQQELRALQAEGAQQQELRTRRVAPLTPGALATYTRLRQQKGGRAVATLHGNICGACRVAVPPTTVAKARPGIGFIPCDNCGRLLYVAH
jgi:predicted  nucleic acid-binding Zn-ribbon protein